MRILCEKVKELLVEEANVQPVSAPVTIVGDLRGNFEDLLTIFEENGWPPDKKYVFLGSYLSLRGHKGCEVLQLLFSLKLHLGLGPI